MSYCKVSYSKKVQYDNVTEMEGNNKKESRNYET